MLNFVNRRDPTRQNERADPHYFGRVELDLKAMPIIHNVVQTEDTTYTKFEEFPFPKLLKEA